MCKSDFKKLYNGYYRERVVRIPFWTKILIHKITGSGFDNPASLVLQAEVFFLRPFYCKSLEQFLSTKQSAFIHGCAAIKCGMAVCCYGVFDGEA